MKENKVAKKKTGKKKAKSAKRKFTWVGAPREEQPLVYTDHVRVEANQKDIQILVNRVIERTATTAKIANQCTLVMSHDLAAEMYECLGTCLASVERHKIDRIREELGLE